jgi:hypothetical protein
MQWILIAGDGCLKGQTYFDVVTMLRHFDKLQKLGHLSFSAINNVGFACLGSNKVIYFHNGISRIKGEDIFHVRKSYNLESGPASAQMFYKELFGYVS